MDTIELLTRAYAARKETLTPDDATARRIIEAATRQLELFGIQRTTMEDVARRAGVSRVTVYRHFPTKDHVVEAVVFHEVQRFLAALGARSDSLATDAERMIEGFVFIVETLRTHTLLRRLLEGEPELFLPQLTTGAGPLIAFARQLIVDYTRERLPDLDETELVMGAEVGIRLALSLILTPESAIDLGDSDGVRRLAARYVAPLIEAADRPRKSTRTRRRS